MYVKGTSRTHVTSHIGVDVMNRHIEVQRILASRQCVLEDV